MLHFVRVWITCLQAGLFGFDASWFLLVALLTVQVWALMEATAIRNSDSDSIRNI